MEMLVKKYQSQKLPKKPPKLLFQKKAVLNFSSKSTMRRFRPKHWQKLLPGKDCIELLVMNFLDVKVAVESVDNI